MAGLTIDRPDVFPQHFEIGRNWGRRNWAPQATRLGKCERAWGRKSGSEEEAPSGAHQATTGSSVSASPKMATCQQYVGALRIVRLNMFERSPFCTKSQ